MKILLFGLRGSGKDTVMEIAKKLFPEFEQLRIAEFVVKACHALGIENPTRDDLAYVGHDIGRKMIDNDIWAKMAIRYAELNPDKHLIVTDCRYPNEYEGFVNLGFVPVLIETDKEKCIERVIKRDGYINMELLEHESETNYLKFAYDLKLDNNGSIIELEKQVDELIKLLRE